MAEEGRIAYGYISRYRERAGYRWCGEGSLYLHKDATGQGLGKRIYGKLIALGRAQGLRHLYASIVLPNPASVHLQTSYGFSLIGLFKGAGYKCGAWRDVAYYGLQLNDSTPAGRAMPMKASDSQDGGDLWRAG